ncbi:MAG: sulfopyruvate decarboxylase subunit beta [Ectothiorhodospiraceae bacterium]|nr:sulfopyruvate decarboxylase subunit beta [Ectothiorhodospiraceae bacterium]
MRRFEATKKVMETIGDELVVCNIGHPSQELFQIRDRPENFYMLGSMGLASSIGLGLAMSQPRKVVVFDGDGSVTMNLGTFATIGRVAPANLVLVVIDNEAYGSTGFQTSFTAGKLDLAGVARAAGIESVTVVDAEDEIVPTMRRVLGEHGPHVVLVKCAAGMPDGVGVIPIDGLAIRDRFMATVRG